MGKIAVIYKYFIRIFLLFFSQKETKLVKNRDFNQYDANFKAFCERVFTKKIALSLATFYNYNQNFNCFFEKQKNIDIFLPENRFKVAILKINSKKLLFKKISDFYNFVFFIKENLCVKLDKNLSEKFSLIILNNNNNESFFYKIKKSELTIFLEKEEYILFNNYIHFLLKNSMTIGAVYLIFTIKFKKKKHSSRRNFIKLKVNSLRGRILGFYSNK